MRRRLICGVMLAVACSGGGTSQDRYTYPGCDDAGTYHCPRSLVFACALQTIQRKHGTCVSDSDCQLYPLQNCFGILTSCPPAAIGSASRASFVEEAEREVTRYCETAQCRGSASCAFGYADGGVRCSAGQCVAVPDGP